MIRAGDAERVEIERFVKGLEAFFERVLWGSRLLVLVAVVGGIVLSSGAFYLGTVDVVYAMRYLADYADPSLGSEERAEVSADALTTIVKAVDEYLIAAILLVFSLGLYELFINRIEAVERSEVAGRLLLIKSLDDLKGRLASLVLLVLAIEFFRHALDLRYESAIDLLYLAVGTLLVSAALYLSTKTLPKGPED